MKKFIVRFSKAALLAMLVISLFSSCNKKNDDDDTPEKSSAKTMTNVVITAGGEDFPATLQEDGETFLFSVPIDFDEAHLKMATVSFTIPSTATADPVSGSEFDFTEDDTYTVTVTAEDGSTAEYSVSKFDGTSDEAAFVSFILFAGTPNALVGVIDDANSRVNIPTPTLNRWDNLKEAVPTFTVSTGANVTKPEEANEPQDFTEEVEYEITAYDGTKRTWKVITDKPSYGIRPGSAQIMFAKKLSADLNITTVNMTEGIAVTRDHVIIHTRGENSIYIDAKTGDYVGEIDLGDVKGDYITADKAGNVLICNRPAAGATFNVWRLDKSLNGNKVDYIEWESTHEIRKISVQGNLDGDAIITAALLYPWSASQTFSKSFAQWTVVGGDLTSEEPEVIEISGLAVGWSFNCDIVSTSATDLNADYFAAYYSDNTFTWINGTNKQVRAKLDEINTSYVPNAVDYIEFNNGKYTTLNWTNSNTWGLSDIVWLLDVTNQTNFTGSLEDKSCPAAVWECPGNTYSWRAIEGGEANSGQFGDVALSVSDDGKTLYLYFMFTNGYVVGVSFDSVD